MKPMPVAAVGSWVRPAGEAPYSLREELRAACPNAPRRLNRLIQLGLIGAHRCAAGRTLPPETPLYMAFSHGSIADSVTLVRDSAAGKPPMPVTFINVSSNMTGFYVAGSLGLASANHVVASNDFAWEATLELAALGGEARRCELVGAVEECAWPLDTHRARLHQPPGTVLLESSQWLLVDRQADRPKAVIQWIRRFPSREAFTDWLAGAGLPAGTRVAGVGVDPDALRELCGGRLEPWSAGEPGYSGIRAAETCCRFIEKGSGSLLHVNCGPDSCYALLMDVNPV